MLRAVGEPSASPPVQRLGCKSHHDTGRVLSYGIFRSIRVDAL